MKILSITGAVLFESKDDTMKITMEAAVHAGASLDGANLVGASLDGASLVGASLVGANLGGASLVRASLVGANLGGASLFRANLDGASLGDSTRLDTGETWKEYLTQTLPTLLTAGGKTLASFTEHWVCHTWDNCPMAHAFDTKNINGIPILLRPRADQFINLFDSKMIPWPLPVVEAVEAK